MNSYDSITFGVRESGHPPMEGIFDSDEIVYCYQGVFDPKTGAHLGTVDVTDQAREREKAK